MEFASIGSNLVETSVELAIQSVVSRLPSITSKSTEIMVLPASLSVWNEKFEMNCSKIIGEIIGKLNGLRRPG